MSAAAQWQERHDRRRAASDTAMRALGILVAAILVTGNALYWLGVIR